MDQCTVLLAPDVTDMCDRCAWMALSGKLAQVDSESYVDVAAITSEYEPKFFLIQCTSLYMWLEESL